MAYQNNVEEPKNIKLKADEHDHVVDTINSRITSAKQSQEVIFNNFTDYYDYYRAKNNDEADSSAPRSTVTVPYIKQIVDAILPRMVSSKPTINILPREESDIEDAQIMEKYVAWQWEYMEMYRKIKMWAKTSLIYGIGILKIGWDYSEGEKDECWVELISNYDFFMDPTSSDIDSGWCAYKRERDLEDLKKNDNYSNLDQLEQRLGTDNDTHKIKELSSTDRSEAKKDKKRKKVVLYEYYGRLSLSEDEPEEDYLVTMVDDVIIRIAKLEEIYPCGKPFVALVDDPMPLDFWPMGEVEPLMPLQDELNTYRRQRIDNRNLIINHMWLVNKEGGINWDDFVSRPGGIIECNDTNAVKPLPVNDTTASSVQEESIVKQDMDRTSGVFPGMMGQLQLPPGVQGSDVFTQTKGGYLASIEQGGTRMQYKLDNLDDALRRLGEKILKLNAKYVDKDQMIRVVGRQGVNFETVSAEAIQKEYDFRVEGGSTQPQNKEATLNKYLQTLQLVAPLSQAQLMNYEPGSPPTPTQLNLKYFLDNLLEELDLPNQEEAYIDMQSLAPPPLSPEQFYGETNTDVGPSEQGLESTTSQDQPGFTT